MVDPQRRREHILDSGAEVLLRGGYDRLTMAEVAQAAGLSRTIIYRHFTSKIALTDALVRRELTGYAARWRTEVDQERDPGTVPSFYRAAFRAYVGRPLLIAIATRDREILGSYLDQPDSAMPVDHGISGLRDFLAVMQAAGAVRADVDLEAMAVVLDALSPALLSGAAGRTTVSPSAQRISDTVVEMLDKMLTPQNADHRAGLATVDAVLFGSPHSTKA